MVKTAGPLMPEPTDFSINTEHTNAVVPAGDSTEASVNLKPQVPLQADFVLGNSQIAPGSRMVVDIPFGKLYTHTELNIGAHVIHGKRPGPV
jgi:hypothetical protein